MLEKGKRDESLEEKTETEAYAETELKTGVQKAVNTIGEIAAENDIINVEEPGRYFLEE